MFKLPQRQVHLDFHTSERIDGVGSMFSKEQFQNCLRKGHVNSITVFAKCHHGWAFFPAEKNVMHPGLHGFDLLGAMLEACREIGVAAPVYISAGLDERYACEHPDHTALSSPDARYPKIYSDESGKYALENPHFHRICMNSPYLDLLVEQTREVVEKYDPVALFFDIVAEDVFRCFCPRCRRSVIELGLDPEDPESYAKHARIMRKRYHDAINEAARAIKPDIRIFHNGGHIPAGRLDLAHSNTHLELESLPTGGWGYDHFPKTAKYVANLGMEYLGMTGKFHTTWGEFGGFKHPNALRYEVALSLALGAKCSIGDQMHPYAFLDEATYELIGIAYAEAEAVEEYCYGIRPEADIAIVSYEGASGKDGKDCRCDVGATRMMLECHYLFDIVDASCDLSKYKLLVLPDKIRIEGELGESIKKFTQNGGKVLCSGMSGTDKNGAAALDIGVEILGECEYNPTYFHPKYRALGLSPANYVFYNNMYEIRVTDPSARVLATTKIPFFNRAPEHFCSHRHTPFTAEEHSAGVVIGRAGAYIAWDIFEEYATKGSYVLKDTVLRVIEELIGEEKSLYTNLPAQGIVTLNEQTKEHRHVLHALYAAPVRRGESIDVIEDLVPIVDTEFKVKVPQIKRARLVPQNIDIPFSYEDGYCSFRIDRFECKQLVVLEHA